MRDRTFLLVERYDRVRSEDGLVRRIHQEDFCQALESVPLPMIALDAPGNDGDTRRVWFGYDL